MAPLSGIESDGDWTEGGGEGTRMQRGEGWLLDRVSGSVFGGDGLIVGVWVGEVLLMVVCLHCNADLTTTVGLVLIELEEDE